MCVGILRYSERPRATTTEQPPERRISSTARSIGEWKPLITILSVWAISCAHRLARSRASGGAVRDAKKATKYLSNNSLLPDKSIKKAQATVLTYPVLRPWLPTKRISNTDSPRWMIYRTHRANVGGKDIHLAWTSDCESSFCLNRQVRVRKITTINVY